jgi:rod shape-determining protein MreD
MKKIPIILLTIFFLLLIQKSFLPHFSFQGAVFNLVLIFVFFIAFFESRDSKAGIAAALAGGAGLDIFSLYFFGVFILLMAGTLVLIKILKPFFERDRVLSFILLWGAVLVFYYSILAIASYPHSLSFTLFGFFSTLLFGLLAYLLRICIYVPFKKRIKQ